MNPWQYIRCVGVISAALTCVVVPALADAPADPDDWIAEEERVRARIAAVNEGGLTFIAPDAGREVHRHAGEIVITPQSLRDGWVGMRQCHVRLDQVSAAQIVFNPERSRALEVVSYRNIDEAFAEGSSIQLRGIGADSEICLRAESRALHRVDEGVYELQNGPFMRRFLDGYYPLQLSLDIEYPPELVLVDHLPEVQPGFEVVAVSGRVGVQATFEGELRTAFRFVER